VRITQQLRRRTGIATPASGNTVSTVAGTLELDCMLRGIGGGLRFSMLRPALGWLNEQPCELRNKGTGATQAVHRRQPMRQSEGGTASLVTIRPRPADAASARPGKTVPEALGAGRVPTTVST
jgi:hypothetical protein